MAGEEMLADIRVRLHKKSIHEVRLIARAVGVHSPTDGKKDYIIEEIMAIASCKKQPSPRSARGAPPKSNDFDGVLVADIRACINYFNALNTGKDAGVYELSDGSELNCSGILDMNGKYACLHVNGLRAGDGDVYVAETVINRFNLRRGDKIEGVYRRTAEGSALSAITSVNGLNPCEVSRREFSSLTPVYPDKRICLGSCSGDICARMADMFAPLGLGQRAVISAPAAYGKTALIGAIASAVSLNERTSTVIFLAGGYPEEITYIRRAIKSADVFSTPLSSTAEENAAAAGLVGEYCKRLTECGKNAVLIVGSLSVLAGAAMPLLSSAINAEEGGSLTVIGFVNAPGEYGSQNSAELIGAANMRLIISNDGAPAVDILKSFTLGREYLQSGEEIETAVLLKKRAAENLGEVLNIFGGTANNAEIIKNVR